MIWFTADTHFDHKKILFYAKRKIFLKKEEQEVLESVWEEKKMQKEINPSWESVSLMNDHLIDKINQYVKKDDVLWHLGDFSFSKRKNSEKYAKKIRERINCKNVFLIKGNHDSKEIASVFEESYDYYELKFESKFIVMSHYCHSFWNKSHYKSWMLYGHAHGTAEKWLDEHMPDRLSMDVGVDNVFNILGEYRPISFFEINQIFQEKSGFNIDGNQIKNFTQ